MPKSQDHIPKKLKTKDEGKALRKAASGFKFSSSDFVRVRKQGFDETAISRIEVAVHRYAIVHDVNIARTSKRDMERQIKALTSALDELESWLVSRTQAPYVGEQALIEFLMNEKSAKQLIALLRQFRIVVEFLKETNDRPKFKRQRMYEAQLAERIAAEVLALGKIPDASDNGEVRQTLGIIYSALGMPERSTRHDAEAGLALIAERFELPVSDANN